MPNTDVTDFQTALDLLREQVNTQLAAHRQEMAAALARLGEARAVAPTPDELGDLRALAMEWERRETQLGERIAAKNVEYQALRAKAELDRHRQEAQIADLEKRLAQAAAENGKLQSVLEALMEEHAECSRKPAPAAEARPQELEKLQQLQARLEQSELECANLRNAMENSVALKLARSLPGLNSVRGLFGAKS